jgi:catechol 2,3-dioxygenase-like lactoylglutathione lyase family enzyme
MIDHTNIGVADVGRSARFYDAALGAIGLRRVMQMPDGVGTDGVGYGIEYPVFWIDRYHPHSVRQHTAFVAKSRAEVNAFYAAALKAGGRTTGHRASADPTITPPLFSIRTGTIWKRFFVANDFADFKIDRLPDGGEDCTAALMLPPVT